MNGKTTRLYGTMPAFRHPSILLQSLCLRLRTKLADKTTKRDVETAMQGHIIAKGELVGLYSK